MIYKSDVIIIISILLIPSFLFYLEIDPASIMKLIYFHGVPCVQVFEGSLHDYLVGLHEKLFLCLFFLPDKKL